MKKLADARLQEKHLEAIVHELEEKAGWQEHSLVNMRVSLEDAHNRLATTFDENRRLQDALAQAEVERERMKGEIQAAQGLASERYDENQCLQTALAQAE
eukprot:2641563-Rhodomonas_salina.1